METAKRLGFSEAASAWLESMPGGGEVTLPAESEVAGMLEFCSVAEQDAREMIAARPDRSRDPDWWTVMAAMVSDLDRSRNRPVPPSGFKAWPVMPETASPIGMFAGAWALLSRLPELVDLHARHGVPESVTKATVSSLGGVLGTHRQVTGRAGVGLFPLWGPPLRFRGTDFQIGRHSFTRTQLALGDDVAGHVLMIHVPPIGPLDAAVSEESIEAAGRYFDEWFPEEPVASFVGTSWLLDPQLGEYLKSESNILQFQRRFDLLPYLQKADVHEGDREMMRLGLLLTPPAISLGPEDLARVPQDTTLQRAFVAHLRSGRHWAKRTGFRCVRRG